MFLGKLSKEIFKCKFFIDDPFKTSQKKETNMNLLKHLLFIIIFAFPFSTKVGLCASRETPELKPPFQGKSGEIRGDVFYEKLVCELQKNTQLFSILDWNNSSGKERDLNSNCLLTAEWIMAFAMGKDPQEIKNIRPREYGKESLTEKLKAIWIKWCNNPDHFYFDLYDRFFEGTSESIVTETFHGKEKGHFLFLIYAVDPWNNANHGYVVELFNEGEETWYRVYQGFQNAFTLKNWLGLEGWSAFSNVSNGKRWTQKKILKAFEIEQKLFGAGKKLTQPEFKKYLVKPDNFLFSQPNKQFELGYSTDPATGKREETPIKYDLVVYMLPLSE